MFSAGPPGGQGRGVVSSRELALELQTSQGEGAAPSPRSHVSGSGSWEREYHVWNRTLKLASRKLKGSEQGSPARGGGGGAHLGLGLARARVGEQGAEVPIMARQLPQAPGCAGTVGNSGASSHVSHWPENTAPCAAKEIQPSGPAVCA